MPAPRIALVTSAQLPALYEEEQGFPPLLRARGLNAEVVVWSDEGVDWTRFNLVVLRSPWDYFERIAEFRAWLARLERAQVPLQNPQALVRWNFDKHYLAELEAKGVAIVPSRFLARGRPANLARELAAAGFVEAVLKPTISGGAFRTHRVAPARAAALQPALDEILVESGALLQPFVPEIQDEGEWSLLFFDGAFSHAVVKTPPAGDFRVQPQHGGAARAVAPPAELIAEALRIVSLLPVPPLYVRIDGVRVAGRFLLMEVEAIEPYLFTRTAAGSAERYVECLARAARVNAAVRP